MPHEAALQQRSQDAQFIVERLAERTPLIQMQRKRLVPEHSALTTLIKTFLIWQRPYKT